ncbi:hypothetical protein RFI_34001, partial [Reticulomyxa filosa]
YLEIETYKKSKLKYRPHNLKKDGKMSEELKNEKWEELLEMIKRELKLSSGSIFLLVKNSVIFDSGKLLSLWNWWIDQKTGHSYVLDMKIGINILQQNTYQKQKEQTNQKMAVAMAKQLHLFFGKLNINDKGRKDMNHVVNIFESVIFFC